MGWIVGFLTVCVIVLFIRQASLEAQVQRLAKSVRWYLR